MKTLLTAILACACTGPALAQNTTTRTITSQPGPDCGHDAFVFALDNNCIFTGGTTTPANINYGTSDELPYMDWTWNANGCGSGTMRSLIRFTDISTIPAGATIVNAQIEFWGFPSGGYDNSSYPGSPFPTNPGWLKRVTSNWNESTVTWNTQPTTTTTNQVALPASATQWSWNPVFNVTTLVQDIVSSGQNYGFMLQLQTEVHYRAVHFASSDHATPGMRPRLTVTYTYNCALPREQSGNDNTAENPVAIADKVNNSITLFPNPADRNVQVSFHHTGAAPVHIRLVNTAGQVVLSQTYQASEGTNKVELSTSGLAQGMYLVQVEGAAMHYPAKPLSIQ